MIQEENRLDLKKHYSPLLNARTHPGPCRRVAECMPCGWLSLPVMLDHVGLPGHVVRPCAPLPYLVMYSNGSISYTFHQAMTG